MFKKIMIVAAIAVLALTMALPADAARVRKAKKSTSKSSRGVGSTGGGGQGSSIYIGGGYKYVTLEHFGIRISQKGFYSKSGGSASGTVVDPAKAGYADVFHNAQMGDRVEATHTGNGQVQLRKCEKRRICHD
ncbi:MAG: hypothetical protein HC887_10885 [Desulfobacteraceae bacterium]|nr:hypothetical protein [Desulfobacteraceae bacterium]